MCDNDTECGNCENCGGEQELVEKEDRILIASDQEFASGAEWAEKGKPAAKIKVISTSLWDDDDPTDIWGFDVLFEDEKGKTRTAHAWNFQVTYRYVPPVVEDPNKDELDIDIGYRVKY